MIFRRDGDSSVVGILNEQNLYLIPPTVVALLLQYSGSRIIHRDGFSSCKRLTVRLNW